MEGHLGDLRFTSGEIILSLLSPLDHVSLCRLQAAHRELADWGRNQYLWRGLYHAERGRRSLLAPPTDWRTAFRQLRPSWDAPVLDPGGRLGWELLAAEEKVPRTLGGQDPKLFDIGEQRLLVLAGASFAEPRGGLNIRQALDAYLLDISAAATGGAAGGARPSWQPVRVEGRPPPSLHGCCSGLFGDGVVADRLVTFAGGNHMCCHNLTSTLDLAQLPQVVEWTVLDADPARPAPSPRYAGASAVWDGALVCLCGRDDRGSFFGGEELWLLREPQSAAPSWERVAASGEAPSERVWLAALAVGDRLVVYGGAFWTFDSSCWGNDSPGCVFTCDLPTATWSAARPLSRPVPQCRCGAITAVCGRHLFVFGGVDLATRSYLQDVWFYDFSAASWSQVAAEAADGQEPTGARSHGVAVAVPSRRAVLVFGGAQYFNGFYFRDVRVLRQLRRQGRPAGVSAEPQPSAAAMVEGTRGRCHAM